MYGMGKIISLTFGNYTLRVNMMQQVWYAQFNDEDLSCLINILATHYHYLFIAYLLFGVIFLYSMFSGHNYTYCNFFNSIKIYFALL